MKLRSLPLRIGTALIPALVCIGIILPQVAFAGEPSEVVKTTIEQARAVFNNPRLSEERQIEKLRTIAEERFDFGEMAKRSLAGRWNTLTSAQKSEFVPLFSRLIEDSYSARLRRYRNEITAHARDRVLFLDEKIEGPYALVKTHIVTYSGVVVPVNYRLVKKGGKWLGYDVIAEGVSLIANYRSQFSEILRNGSFQELIARIRRKNLKE